MPWTKDIRLRSGRVQQLWMHNHRKTLDLDLRPEYILTSPLLLSAVQLRNGSEQEEGRLRMRSRLCPCG